MPPSISTRFKNAIRAFTTNRDPTYNNLGPSQGYRPDRIIFTPGNEKSQVIAIYNRIALDCASVKLQHVVVDSEDRYVKDVPSYLNECLWLQANIDQNAFDFKKDLILSMFDEGDLAVFPTSYEDSPYDIYDMRTAKVIEWFPKHVRIDVYDDETGHHRQVIASKATTALFENPFFAVMNSRNSTLTRLIRKLTLLDYVDEQSGSGKLDLIVQLPYAVRNEAKRDLAATRIQDLEDQLQNRKYGVAYIDAAEKVIQLNRSVDNNLLEQCNTLSEILYSQLGITQSIMDGTANQETMNNYYSRTIEPIMEYVALEMTRKFLTSNARSRGERIKFFRDPFKTIPTNMIAEIGDKMKRNAIMSTNDLRPRFGLKPSNDPNADKLENPNLKDANQQNQDQNVEPGQATLDPKTRSVLENIAGEMQG